MEDNILEKIYKASLKFLAPLEPEETYAMVVEEARKLVKAEYGSIFLKSEDGLKRVYTSSPVLTQVVPRKRGYVYRAYKYRRAFIIDVKQASKIHPSLREIKAKSIIFIPLSYRNKSMGVLTAQYLENEYFSEQDLRVLNLFGSMASLAIRKTQLYSEAKQASESRNLFISMAAHELRTPVTTVYGYAQLLYKKYTQKNTQEARWVEQLYTESYRLTLLINDLLEINRIRTGKRQYFLEENHLREIFNRALIGFNFNYPHRKVILNDQLGNKSDRVIGDFDKLLQVVTNLLDNAAKFSPTETDIILGVSNKEHYFVITVRDRGKGIAQKDLLRVFEGYCRGTNNQQEGMGLGLFLAKSIIEEHHGSIHIHSKLNKGTLVEVRLPMVKI